MDILPGRNCSWCVWSRLNTASPSASVSIPITRHSLSFQQLGLVNVTITPDWTRHCMHNIVSPNDAVRVSFRLNLGFAIAQYVIDDAVGEFFTI